jgi:hypothetical protein
MAHVSNDTMASSPAGEQYCRDRRVDPRPAIGLIGIAATAQALLLRD